MKNVILASNNKHKVKEFKEMLEPLGFNILTLDDVGFKDEIDETGSTFKENSLIKAKTIYDIYHIDTIADDSGLSVDYLNGDPGVHSHRYAGPDASDKDNRVKLLESLKNFPEPRFAHFTTALTYISDSGVIQVEGYVHGRILKEEKGINGFGYDSLFYVDEIGQTLGEASDELKNSLSHRHNAIINLIKELNK